MKVIDLPKDLQVKLGKLVFDMLSRTNMTDSECYLGALRVFGESIGVELECPHRWVDKMLEYPIIYWYPQNPRTCAICGVTVYDIK